MLVQQRIKGPMSCVYSPQTSRTSIILVHLPLGTGSRASAVGPRAWQNRTHAAAPHGGPIACREAPAAQTWPEKLARAGLGAVLSLLALNASSARAAQFLDVPSIQRLQSTLLSAYDAVEDKFVDPYDHKLWAGLLQESSAKLAQAHSQDEGYGIISGMLASLGDQYTRLLPPEQARAFKADTTGSVVHVGAQLERQATGAGAFVRASYVLTGSPAARAGLRAGDIVHAINGRPAAEVSAGELASLLHQNLHMQVQQSRPEVPMATRDIYLTARPVEVYPVIHQTLSEDDGRLLGYLAIQSFGANTAADTAEALQELLQKGPSGLILDLRGNTGLDVAGLFMDPNAVFCYVTHNDGATSPVLVDSDAPQTTAPLVVLVNGGTASISEMLAGALQASGRSALLGEHTFGKGRTQRVIPLPDASTLLVSNALVTTPDHRHLDKVGLEPSKLCRTGRGLPEALSREPLEQDTLAADLQADPCIHLALQALADSAPQPAHQQA